MFSIKTKTENGFSIFVLKDEESGCFAEVIPGCGATLHAFGVQNSHKNFQVIDHYESKEQFEDQVESLGYKSCKLSPFVCRLQNGAYSFGGDDLQIENIGGGKHALHGLLYKKEFAVISEVANEMHAEISMIYSYRRENTGYPFDYDCIITYGLSGDCKLHLRTECINQSGKGLIPVQDGWHPYFDLGLKVDELELEFQSTEQYIFNKELVPTGEKIAYEEFSSIKPIGSIHLDNSFILDQQECQPLCVVRNKKAGVEIQLFPADSYPILQIYTPPERQSIAIENLSGPPNAFNMGKGFITLEAGQSAVFETAYRINFI